MLLLKWGIARFHQPPQEFVYCAACASSGVAVGSALKWYLKRRPALTCYSLGLKRPNNVDTRLEIGRDVAVGDYWRPVIHPV